MPRQGRLQSLNTPLWRLSLSRSSMARLDTEATVYRLRHSYNKPGEELSSSRSAAQILEILNFDIYTEAT